MLRSSSPALLAACLLLSVTRPARADEPTTPSSDLVWRDDWARFRTWEYVAVPVLGLTMLGVGLATPGSREPSWVGRNGLDDGGRSALRLRSSSGRAWARHVSDVLYIGMTIYPAAIEALLLARVVHKSPDVAWQLFMMYGETALTTGLITITAQGNAYRARPLVPECARDPGYDPMCGTRQLSRSFFAGHVSMATMGAALTCVNQAHLPLYGGWGKLVCGAMIAGASTTAVLRVSADKHWTSDVLTGLSIGALAGTLMPLGLHYGFGPARPQLGVIPTGDGGGLMTASGLF